MGRKVTRPGASGDRPATVSSFFSGHAASWHGRYDARGFDDWEYQTRGRIALEWLEELLPHGGRHLLEIGCGAGVQSEAAARQGWRVVAVDFAKGMLAEARGYSRAPAWTAAVVEALPFRPHSFDAVLMNGVIGYVSDPAAALRSVREQLRPKGAFLVSWASPHPLLFETIGRAVSAVPDAVYLGLTRLLTRRRPIPVAQDPGFYDRYLRRWTPEEFYALLETAGFAIARVRSQNFGQFRFMDHAVWPTRVDIGLSECLDRFAGSVPRGRLRGGARTHIALATSTGS